ncbi:sulfotransferase domain-containing protein [Thermodesulfobacteriota bacterium]
MFGKAIKKPFHRNRFPEFCESVMHGHYLNPWGMKNVIIVWRDGRDVMVSWYHYCLFVQDNSNVRIVKKTRKNLSFKDFNDVKRNMPEFIDYAFNIQRNPGFSWADFVQKWLNRKNVIYTRYEDLHRNTSAELRRIVLERTGKEISNSEAKQIAAEFSFSRQTKRQVGKEKKNSFLRKGIIGDWKNYFNQQAREVFDWHAGNCLIRLGYEKNNAWVGGD